MILAVWAAQGGRQDERGVPRQTYHPYSTNAISLLSTSFAGPSQVCTSNYFKLRNHPINLPQLQEIMGVLQECWGIS